MLSELRKVWCDTWVSSLVACTGPATGRAVFVICILCLSKDLFLYFLRNLVSVVYRAARFSFFKSTAALKVKGGGAGGMIGYLGNTCCSQFDSNTLSEAHRLVRSRQPAHEDVAGFLRD